MTAGGEPAGAPPAFGHQLEIGAAAQAFEADAAVAEAGGSPPPERAASWAVQRVSPRALAQYGEVKELELEVPVPSMWVGGHRMTLQLRLTLVPQEEEHSG